MVVKSLATIGNPDSPHEIMQMVRTQLNRYGALTAVAFLILLSGCSNDGSPKNSVRGAVVYNGKPVTAGEVKFHPEDGGSPTVGQIGIDGDYIASSIKPGKYKVTVETKTFKNLKAPPKGMDSGKRPIYVETPAKYEKTDTTDLSFTVDKIDNEWSIELK